MWSFCDWLPFSQVVKFSFEAAEFPNDSDRQDFMDLLKQMPNVHTLCIQGELQRDGYLLSAFDVQTSNSSAHAELNNCPLLPELRELKLEKIRFSDNGLVDVLVACLRRRREYGFGIDRIEFIVPSYTDNWDPASMIARLRDYVPTVIWNERVVH